MQLIANVVKLGSVVLYALGIVFTAFELTAPLRERVAEPKMIILTLIWIFLPAGILYVVHTYLVKKHSLVATYIIPSHIGLLLSQIVCVTAVLTSIIFVGLEIRSIDTTSTDKAADRADRVVPNPHDSSTWSLPSDASAQSVYDSGSRKERVWPPLATGTAAVTSENIASGNVLVELYDQGRSQLVFFTDGGKIGCTVAEFEEFPINPHDCGDYKMTDMTFLHFYSLEETDAVRITRQRYNKEWFTDVRPGLMVYTKSGIPYVSIVNIAPVNKIHMNNSLSETLPLDQVSQNIHDQSLVTGDILSSDQVVYQTFNLPAVAGTVSFVLQGVYSKYGPVYRIFKTEGDLLVQQFKLPVYNSTESSAGVVTVRNKMESHSVRTWYSYPSRFNKYAAGTSQEVMYMTESCGLPNTFSDWSAYIYPFTTKAGATDAQLSLNISVGIASSPTWNLTTADYGYVPEQWGQVIERVDTASYLREVQQGVSFKDLATELLALGGTPVRHTLPYYAPRPCEGRTYEQYQWVKDNQLYSVLVQYKSDAILSPELRTYVTDAVTEMIGGTSYAAATQS